MPNRCSRQVSLVALVIALTLLLAGCGGSSTPTTNLTGQVVDLSGPVSGAVIRVGPKVTTTGSDGGFSLAGVSTGTQRIWITKEEHAPWLNTRSLPAGNLALGTITLDQTPGTSFYAIQTINGSGSITLDGLQTTSKVAIIVASRDTGGAISYTTPAQAMAAITMSALPGYQVKGAAGRILGAFPAPQDFEESLRESDREVSRIVMTSSQHNLNYFGFPNFVVPPPDSSFWVITSTTVPYTMISRTASLKYQSDKVYIYRASDLTDADISPTDIGTLGTAFGTICDTTRNYFGSEPNPGVDSDPHIFIVLTKLPAPVAGYFWSINELTEAQAQSIHPNYHSNVREIFFVDPTPGPVNLTNLKGVLAHEFEHMIFWNERTKVNDPEQPTWLNEALAEMSIEVNGLGIEANSTLVAGHIYDYAWDTSRQSLTIWGEQTDTGDYGAAYLFMRYLTDRFNLDKIKAIVTGTPSGTAAVANAAGMAFDDLFTDWTMAMLLDQRGWVPLPPSPPGKRFNYSTAFFHRTYGPITLDGPGVYPSLPPSFRSYPYGVDYSVLTGFTNSSLNLSFQVQNSLTEVLIIKRQ